MKALLHPLSITSYFALIMLGFYYRPWMTGTILIGGGAISYLVVKCLAWAQPKEPTIIHDRERGMTR